MNKELELEAEEYKSRKKIIPTTELENAISKLAFIDGATSKYVERQKLEFAIEQFKYVREQSYNTRQFKAVLLLDGKIKELEQQLKELEYETN